MQSQEPIVLGFSDSAQDLYIEWFNRNLEEIENSPLHLEAHFSKYPSLIPSLALLFHLVEGGDLTEISEQAIIKALCYSEYLKVHAKRIYGLTESFDQENALIIAARFEKLGSDFTVRDVVRAGWAGIGKSKEKAQSAIDVLVEHGYVMPQDEPDTMGRPTTRYLVVNGEYYD